MPTAALIIDGGNSVIFNNYIANPGRNGDLGGNAISFSGSNDAYISHNTMGGIGMFGEGSQNNGTTIIERNEVSTIEIETQAIVRNNTVDLFKKTTIRPLCIHIFTITSTTSI